MKKVWILEKLKDDKWSYEFGNSNYYKFVGGAKKVLREYDTQESNKLKTTLGTVEYSTSIRDMFKNLHTFNKTKFRVSEGMLEEDMSIEDAAFVKLNPDLYSFLWNTKYITKGN